MKIVVRDCRKEDASQAACLLMMAWPVEDFLAMDGNLTEEMLHKDITRYVEAENTLYSYKNTKVAVMVSADGQERIVGAMNGYDGALYRILKRPIAEDLKARYPGASDDFADLTETEAGEFYLDSIGVDPELRSCGVGTLLFEAMIEKAGLAGHAAVGLIVDVDKPRAEALYLRLGFRHVGFRDFLGHSMKHMQKEL